MDLATVLRQVPTLLDACICNEIPVLKLIRLVSKELSRLAFISLKTYSLSLRSHKGYKAVSVAKLLRQAQLRHLSVDILLSGEFSPSGLVEAFAREAGSSLKTLTSLDLNLQDTGSSCATAAALDNALMLMLSTCTALTTCTFSGHPSHDLLQSIGKSSPLLSELRITHACREDNSYLQSMLKEQPTLLPHITSLAFIPDNSGGFRLPDISGNHGIVCLTVHGCHFSTDAHWASLPHNLQVLRCKLIQSGPLHLADGSVLLPKLQQISMLGNTPPLIPLSTFAKLAVNAPALLTVLAATRSDHMVNLCPFIITVQVKQTTAATTAAHLMLLHPMLARHALFNATFLIDCTQSEGGDTLQAVISTLPRMQGIKRCIFRDVAPGELGPLLACFADLWELEIQASAGLADFELQEVASNYLITTLTLSSCDELSPTGLVSLCHGLHNLKLIKCRNCAQLGEIALAACVQLLQRRGLPTMVVYVA